MLGGSEENLGDHCGDRQSQCAEDLGAEGKAVGDLRGSHVYEVSLANRIIL